MVEYEVVCPFCERELTLSVKDDVVEPSIHSCGATINVVSREELWDTILSSTGAFNITELSLREEGSFLEGTQQVTAVKNSVKAVAVQLEKPLDPEDPAVLYAVFVMKK